MSNSDSFIDEVTEDLRRDRLFGVMRRWGWIGILAVLGIVGGAAWNEYRAAQDRAAAQALGDQLRAALETPDAGPRAEALAGLSVAGAASAPAAFLQAGALAEAGEIAAAGDLLAGIAADPGHPAVWRDLAGLQRVILLGRSIPPEDRIAALDPLAVPGGPFRPLAQEQIAYARLDAGDRDAAVALMREIMADQQATAGLRQRVGQAMVVLGADVDGG